MDNSKPLIIASDKSWIEGEAIRQLENTARLPGMIPRTQKLGRGAVFL